MNRDFLTTLRSIVQILEQDYPDVSPDARLAGAIALIDQIHERAFREALIDRVSVLTQSIDTRLENLVITTAEIAQATEDVAARLADLYSIPSKLEDITSQLADLPIK